MRRSVTRAVALLLVAAAACTPGGAKSAPDAVTAAKAGGDMSEGVRRLGGVKPGKVFEGGRLEIVDPKPIVLWAGEEPAAVVYYRLRQEERSDVTVEELAVVPESVPERLRGGKGFPLVVKSKRVATESEAARVDRLAPNALINADVDGDGVDELIACHELGGVDVVGLKARLAHYPGPSKKTETASYRPARWQTAEVKGRAIVHLLLERMEWDGANEKELARVGAVEPYALLRVDARGVTPVALTGPGWPVKEVLAVAAINRPGSADVDELVVLSVRERDEAWVSRHRPDGRALDAGRKVYVPLVRAGYDAAFLPQSRVTVLSRPAESELYFVEAEKPANWIRRVDVRAALGTDRAFTLGVADASSNPKALVRAEESVYAVDAEGTYYTATGAGAFVPAAKPAPFFVAKPPTPQHGAAVILPSSRRGDELLVVHKRPGGPTRPANEEIVAAAERFLSADDLADERREAQPQLERNDPVRDRLVREEARRRGIDPELRSLEEWRRLLPDSYAAMVRDLQDRFHARLWADLTFPREHPSALGDYRDPEGLRRWLAAIDVAPEVSIAVVRRGAVLRSIQVPAQLGPLTPSDVGRAGLEWRTGQGADVVVTGMTFPESDPKPSPVFTVLRTGTKAR